MILWFQIDTGCWVCVGSYMVGFYLIMWFYGGLTRIKVYVKSVFLYLFIGPVGTINLDVGLSMIK